MNIISGMGEALRDPMGILEGLREEWRLAVEVEEGDEVERPGGVDVRAIVRIGDGGELDLLQAHFLERSGNETLPFDLEEEEERAVLAFIASARAQAL